MIKQSIFKKKPTKKQIKEFAKDFGEEITKSIIEIKEQTKEFKVPPERRLEPYY